MPRNPSGVYTRPNNSFSQPVVNTPISHADAAALFADIEAEVTDSLSRSGKGAMTAALDMGSHKVVNLTTGTAATDAATVGQSVQKVETVNIPAASYTDTPTIYTTMSALIPRRITVNSDAGYQQNFDSDSGGRTMLPVYLTTANFTGMGDITGFESEIGIGAHSGVGSVTRWTGRNTANAVGGLLGAFTDNVNLCGAEWHFEDNAHASVAAHGIVLNFERTGATGAYVTPWMGMRIQNAGGVPMDVGVSFTGKINVGLDFTAADLGTNKSAIALKTNDKIYFGADATGPSASWFAGDAGTLLRQHFISYDGTKFAITHNGTPALQVSDALIVTAVPMTVTGGSLSASSAIFAKEVTTNDALTIPDIANTAKVSRHANFSGGANTGVSAALWVDTRVEPGVPGKQWGFLSTLYNDAVAAGQNNENVAIYGQSRSVGGASTWAGVFEVRDYTVTKAQVVANPTTAAPTSTTWGMEIDCVGNGVDTNLKRRILNLVFGNEDNTSPVPAEIGYGVLLEAFGDDAGSTAGLAKCKVGFAMSGTYTLSGFDTSTATMVGPALNMAAGHKIAWGTRKLRADGVSGFAYDSGSGDVFQVTDTGALVAAGDIYSHGLKVVGARDTGWTAMTGTGDESTVYAVGSVTLPQLAARVKALQDALTTHGLIGT